MEAAKKDKTPTLSIQRITPVDLDNPIVKSALEQARIALTNPRLQKILAVRTAISHYVSGRLIQDGFVHPPMYMLAGCTDPLNHWTYPARMNYYGEEVSVSQSLIFQKILMVMLSGADKVYWISPNIRMEMLASRKDYKYASEFSQIDFEQQGATSTEIIAYIKTLISDLFAHLQQRHGDVITEIRGEPLPELDGSLLVADVEETKKEHGLESDDEVERWVSSRCEGKPFILTNLKREAYDAYDEDQDRFLNYDLVLPPVGDNPHPIECLSGAERTKSLTDLAERMTELDYPMSYFAPFFELFESVDPSGEGKISCAGAGLGVERLTHAILGLKDIHEQYPFPRPAEGKIAI